MIGAYLIGQPGSGKSTLLRALTDGAVTSWERKPFAHALYFDGFSACDPAAAQLGGHHPDFPGTDRLSMGVQPLAIQWVQAQLVPCVVGEGDRLATAGFLDALEQACELFDLVWLDTPDDLAAERRSARGSNQNETWLRGRLTKIGNLLDSRPATRLDGSMPVDQLVARAVEDVPALRVLAQLAR